MRIEILTATFFVVSCTPLPIVLSEGARLVCTTDDDCPAEFFCIEAIGQCSAGGPCIAQGTEDPVADGTPCDDGNHCIEGACVAPSCGDGVVSFPQEQCDPRRDLDCREDCSVPFCGDLIVDVGETCDEISTTCGDCIFVCGSDGNPLAADCDLDQSSGCECEPTIFPIPFLTFSTGTGAMTADGGAIFTAAVSDDDFIRVISVSEGEDARVLFDDLNSGGVVRFNDEVFLARSSASGGNVIEVLSPTPRTLVQRGAGNDDVFGLVAGEGLLLERSASGVSELDAQTGEERFISPQCDSTLAATVICGGRLVCFSDLQLVAIDLADGTVEVIEDREETAVPICVAGSIFWTDERGIFRLDDDGTSTLLKSVGRGGGSVTSGYQATFANNHLLFSYFSNELNALLTFSYDFETDALTVPYSSGLIDSDGSEVLLHDFGDTSALVRFKLGSAR